MWNNDYNDDSGWDKNYRIPKRKMDQEYNECRERPVFNRSVYNYYNQYSQSHWQQGMQYSQNQAQNPVEPITQNIFNTLSNIKEKPKNQQKNIFRETVPDVEDSTLPKELTAMFQPLYCKLCSAQLSSNIMAKLHYKSKNHEKKIKKFLVEYSERTGEPLHKRAKATATTTTKTEEEQNPTWFHCDICDLPLTGKLHAESHYMGKNHQKAVRGHKAPAGKGFYNNEGKWVRLASVKSSSNMGQDTFGLDFRPKPVDQHVPERPATPEAPIISTKFECNLCNIGTTCQEQLDMHYKGQKHQKKLKHLGMMTTLSQGSSNKPASTVEPKPLDNINLSVHRTPSGDFYCQNCNLSLNSEPQFILHIKSKGHLKKNFHKQ